MSTAWPPRPSSTTACHSHPGSTRRRSCPPRPGRPWRRAGWPWASGYAMNFVQLLQVVGVTALVTLALALLLLRLRATLRGWLRRRLPPRYLKPLGIRHRAARQEPRND